MVPRRSPETVVDGAYGCNMPKLASASTRAYPRKITWPDSLHSEGKVRCNLRESFGWTGYLTEAVRIPVDVLPMRCQLRGLQTLFVALKQGEMAQ